MTAKSWKFHATLWAVFHLVSMTIDYAMSTKNPTWGLDWLMSFFKLDDIVFLLQAISICYLTIWLSRKIFPTKPVLFFVVMLVPMLFLAVTVDYITSIFFDPHFKPNTSFKAFYGARSVVNGVIVVFGFMVKLFVDFLDSEQRRTAVVNEKNAIELAFLKSQINPHFLFNTLNNLYGLSLSEPDKTPDAIIKLSDMMRYMLYESNAERVPLQQEITYLKSYIDLQKMRYAGTTFIQFNVVGTPNGQQIAPLLLIGFVENAFKHGDVFDAEHPLSMSLSFDAQHVVFDVTNKIHHRNKDEVGGIGIENVERRLALLYPKKHTLTVQNDENVFESHLEIEL